MLKRWRNWSTRSWGKASFKQAGNGTSSYCLFIGQTRASDRDRLRSRDVFIQTAIQRARRWARLIRLEWDQDEIQHSDQRWGTMSNIEWTSSRPAQWHLRRKSQPIRRSWLRRHSVISIEPVVLRWAIRFFSFAEGWLTVLSWIESTSLE